MENVRAYSFNDSLIVELSGEHDMSTIPHVEPAMASASREKGVVVVDLSQATFVDSSVLSMLLRAHKKLGTRMRVVLTSGSRVRHIFEVTQMDRYIAIVESVSEALRPSETHRSTA